MNFHEWIQDLCFLSDNSYEEYYNGVHHYDTPHTVQTGLAQITFSALCAHPLYTHLHLHQHGLPYGLAGHICRWQSALHR